MPSALVYIGAIIVAGAGLFVIWRERQLGLKRAREAEGPRRPEICTLDALKVMMVWVSLMPVRHYFSLTKWPISVPAST